MNCKFCKVIKCTALLIPAQFYNFYNPVIITSSINSCYLDFHKNLYFALLSTFWGFFKIFYAILAQHIQDLDVIRNLQIVVDFLIFFIAIPEDKVFNL